MLTNEQITEQIEEVLESLEPYFMMHGGQITFDRFEEGTVYVKLSGNCGGCPSSSYTLKMLVESELKKEIPQVETVEEVLD
ncbi:MAG: NifU family protein [Candidatus Dependentiae bacterium]|jgi:Fe-S cluster biogenesis protein NfuA